LFGSLVGDGLSKEGENFVHLLAENSRLRNLPAIATLYEKYRAATEQTIDVKVTTAIELSEDYKKRLAKFLDEKLNGKTELDCEVKPELLGGILIRAGDRVIDSSLIGQLSKLREALVD